MTRHVRFTFWTSTDGLDSGEHDGTTAEHGPLTVRRATSRRTYCDPHRAPHWASRADEPGAVFEQATWTSPEVEPGFPAEELVASWNATTPPGSWVEVAVRAHLDDGRHTDWAVLGRWAETDEDISPTSVPGQRDALCEVAADTWRVHAPRHVVGYRVRVHLLRTPDGEPPSLTLVGVMASTRPTAQDVPVSHRGAAPARLVDVPAFSQLLHRGEYPHWDSGGDSWCSPTSTTMVLAHWGRLPSPAEYAWVDPRFADRFVDHAARHTFDHAYGGAGNWAFNTAYAARHGTTAFVTRLRDLTEAERFIAAGVPLVLGVAFGEDELTGAGYATHGHLLVLVGFDERGDVVVNDPASHGVADNARVRTTFDRGQFERAWLGVSGGVTYVIHPPEVALPPRPAEPNW